MNILLIYGGKSCEHDISIITACLARGYFDGKLYSAYLSQQNICYLVPNDFTPKQHKNCHFKQQLAFLLGRKQVAVVQNNKIKKVLDIDVVVNCCHGQNGEDGAVAALCNLSNLPLVGSDIIPSAIAMDKITTKQVLAASGFPVVQGVTLTASNPDVASVEKLGYPIIVKPSTLGSSIGITLCRNREQLIQAIKAALAYDSRVLCEKALTDFYEVNCAAISTAQGIQTSAVERPYTTNEILTFADKYRRGQKFVAPPAQIPAPVAAEAQSLTAQIYKQLGFSGVVRIDFLVDSAGLYVNEINSIPGSLAYGLFQHKYSPKQFGALLVQSAQAAYQATSALTHTFSSGVLDASSFRKK